MARPRKFEREPMLNQALEVFWTKGYEATSVQDLVEALGIHPGTLYATFGDKHTLFLEVLDHYGAAGQARFGAILRQPGSKRKAIEQFFEFTIDGLLSPTGKRGCLLGNTAVERSGCDAPATARATHYHAWLEDTLYHALQQAQTDGELPVRPPAELRTLAQFLNNNIQGMTIVARTSAGPQALRGIARLALQALD